KSQNADLYRFYLGISSLRFEFVSDFDIRISDFSLLRPFGGAASPVGSSFATSITTFSPPGALAASSGCIAAPLAPPASGRPHRPAGGTGARRRRASSRGSKGRPSVRASAA